MNRALFSAIAKRFGVAIVAGGVSMAMIGSWSAHAETDKSTAQHDMGQPNGAGHDDGHGDWHGGRCARMNAFLAHMDKKLTPDQVRDIVAGRLAERGEGTLKVGKVSTKAPDVVSVEIVTTAGSSLVSTRDISTKTGLSADLGKNCEQHEHMAGKMEGHMGGHGFRHGGFLGAMALGGGHGRDLNLSVDQVKKLADAALIMAGNPRLKVGAVKEKDADTVSVDIVTLDNALVFHREVDRHTGHVHRAA
jgi:hypothetical protein